MLSGRGTLLLKKSISQTGGGGGGMVRAMFVRAPLMLYQRFIANVNNYVAA